MSFYCDKCRTRVATGNRCTTCGHVNPNVIQTASDAVRPATQINPPVQGQPFVGRAPVVGMGPSVVGQPVVMATPVQPMFVQPTYVQPVVMGAVTPVVVTQNKTNGFAIASLVLSLLCGAPLGVIFGHIALSQIERTHEEGRGLAIAGLVIGYVSLAFLLPVFFFPFWL
jgi:Domain of unknown function (DUF4190)